MDTRFAFLPNRAFNTQDIRTLSRSIVYQPREPCFHAIYPTLRALTHHDVGLASTSSIEPRATENDQSPAF